MKVLKNKHNVFFIVIVFLLTIQIAAQKKVNIQSSVPHPIMELDQWQIHTGDLSVDQIFETNSKIKWESESIGQIWRE